MTTSYGAEGIATTALTKWVDAIFHETDALEHIGMTTWSGKWCDDGCREIRGS